jgi:hypothetical protein
MSQVFHRSTNTLARFSIFGLVFLLGGGLWLIAAISRSSYITETDVVRAQPVPFSHEHHVGGLGIDCRYCHTSVEVSSFAGLPSTATCMNCHSQIWSGSDVLKPVRDSYQSGVPIRWTRVHNLPDFVYFDHSIHVNKGVPSDLQCTSPDRLCGFRECSPTCGADWGVSSLCVLSD